MAKLRKIILISFILGFLFTPQLVFAADAVTCGKRPNTDLVLNIFPSLWRNVDPCDLSLGDIPTILGNVALLMLAFGSLIALIMIVVGGIQYIMSAGNPDMLRLAQNTLMYSIGGFILCIAAYSIVRFILGGFGF